jgi:hypothetical protein
VIAFRESALASNPAIAPSGMEVRPVDKPNARSRRDMLLAGLGGLAGLIGHRLGQPQPVDAAAGGALRLGLVNSAGTQTTTLTANVAGNVFQVLQPAGGTAAIGWATTGSGATRGLYGRSDSTSGRGVAGYASAATGAGFGVLGQGVAPGATGVKGQGLATSGDSVGVRAVTGSPTGRALVVTTPGANGAAIGVDIQAPGIGATALRAAGGTVGIDVTAGAGVTGTAGTAVHAESSGLFDGQAIFGWNHAPGTAAHEPWEPYPGIEIGPVGISGVGRTGVMGGDGPAAGVGVVGRTNHASGWAGGFFSASGNGVAISTPADKIGLTVVGGSKNAVVATSSGARLMYAEEAAEVVFADYGASTTSGGEVRVEIDPRFAETVDLATTYHVFIESYGPIRAYVAGRDPEAFVVRSDRSDIDVEFSYRVVATRRGHGGRRLERAPWADADPNLGAVPIAVG